MINSVTQKPRVERSSTGGDTHIVNTGDTLSAIARQHGVRLDELVRANPQIENPNLIRPGQEVRLPASLTPAGDGAADPAPTRAPVDAGVQRDARTVASQSERAVQQQVEGQLPSSGPGSALQRGARGPEVQALQRRLIDFGYMTQAEMSTGPGIFGPKTERALSDFQRENQLTVNGRVDDATRASLAGSPRARSVAPGAAPRAEDVQGARPVLGAGSAADALAWSADQMAGGSGAGVNSNNNRSVAEDPKAWNNWCLAFVATAYGRRVENLQSGSAIGAFNKFNADGEINTSRSIPPGAPVFFQATNANGSFGHIAIATGRTTPDGDPIIRTSGWNGRDGITELPLSRLEAMTGSYLGYGVIS